MIVKLAPYGTLIVLVGAMMAALGAYLQSQNNRVLNADLRAKSIELINLQNGLVAYTKGLGSYFYLEVSAVGGANFAIMHAKRVGTNPVYEAKANIVDSQASLKPQLIQLGTIANDAITGAWKLGMDFGDSRNLTVFLTSRNAEHRQDIRLRRIGGHIFAASRVVETFSEGGVMHEKIDDGFPLDEQGRVDWSH